MAESDAVEAYNILVHWLIDNKLEWVAQQIEEETSLGKTEPRRLSISDSDIAALQRVYDPPRIAPPKSQSAEFLVRVDYSPYEKFDIALSAIRSVVIGAIKMQEALANTLDLDGQEISFVPGETGTIEHRYQRADVEVRLSGIHEAEQLLSQLANDVRK